jgi:predicted RNase H-like HicB family nuclease
MKKESGNKMKKNYTITITPEHYDDGAIEWVARISDLAESLIGCGETPQEALENILIVREMFKEIKKENKK